MFVIAVFEKKNEDCERAGCNLISIVYLVGRTTDYAKTSVQRLNLEIVLFQPMYNNFYQSR